ncbi:PREDICTED: chymotrypsin-1-like [Ceratosolen solmsi marchali]|uniref:Chymotrypsin-1-like n=1 Tax=Ceratosolen solmsi marchali TaxID=326594 RepID=A0AAJ6YM35_9HYME|nr:PREDICTED: chymotrypsin-1-like [Ceratosolen solmsi marchali]
MGHNIRRPSSIEFPFIAGIIRRNRDFITERDTVCTASLITDKNILTAEHCLTNEVVNGLIIIVGSNDLESPSRYYPAWWISFNQWSKLPSSRTTIYSNDIAVINLSTIIRDRIPYGILSFLSYRELRNKDVVTVGWGEINNGSFPRLLHAVNLKVLTKTDCALRARALSGENFKINENLICTVGDPFALLMRGDSGGPLLYKNKIVGINTGTGPLPQQSFHPDKINVHCNLKHYNDFLLNIISYM